MIYCLISIIQISLALLLRQKISVGTPSLKINIVRQLYCSSKGVYVNTRKSKVPLRWLSIEAMRDSLYSSKSDVWAFAVLLWEIGTLGESTLFVGEITRIANCEPVTFKICSNKLILDYFDSV